MSKISKHWKALEEQGKYDEAITYIKMEIEQGTASYDIRKDEGRILNKQGIYKDALKSFDLVLAMNENHSECWFGKGISYLGLFELTDAHDSFIKSIMINDKDANSWYYLAILLKSFGFEQKSKEYFQNFLKLDNDDFKAERECYKFGLIFEQRNIELYGIEKTINIGEFKNELESLNVSQKDINYNLYCLPYDKLVEEILNLREKKYYEDLKNIIYSELSQIGLDDSSILNMFEVESLDNLKEKIISQKGFDPFPTLNKEFNISYYVKTTIEKYVDRYVGQGYPAPHISKFNILEEIRITNYKNNRLNINGKYSSRLISRPDYMNKSEAKKNFNHGKQLISNENTLGLYYLDNALRICPKNDSLYFNIKFYFATVLSRFGYLKTALNYYIELKNVIKSFEKLDSFLFNLGNICYDLKYYKDAANFYDKYLKKNPDCEVVIILKNSAEKQEMINRSW